jgi:hypothetical protein
MPIEQGSLWDEPALPADTKETTLPPAAPPVQKTPARRVSGAHGRNEVYTDAKTAGFMYPTNAPFLGAAETENDEQLELDGSIWLEPQRHTLYTTGEPIVETMVNVRSPGADLIRPIGATGQFREAIQTLHKGDRVHVTTIHRQWFINAPGGKRRQKIGYVVTGILGSGPKKG